MSALIDMIGKTYGFLIVLSRAPNQNGRAYWTCRCGCGVETTVAGYHLRGGTQISCGCKAHERARLMGKRNRRHGLTNSREFQTWTGMISRCTNPRDYRYKRYGGRGIEVCDAWFDFEVFLADVGYRPFPSAELDRIDNDGNYEPGNVRWTTAKQNNNNRSNCRYIEHHGQRLTMTQWAERAGMNPATLRARLESGWPVDMALARPIRRSVSC